MTMACPHFHFMNECRHKVCRLWKGVVITMKIPQHVAIILDGNGRWAKVRECPETMVIRLGQKMWKQSAKQHMIWELNI